MKPLIACLVFTSLLALPRTSHGDERWKITMRTLENSLQALLYESSSSPRFAEALKKESFQKEIARFSSTASELSERKGTSGDADPSIELISSLFKQEAQHLQWAAKNKNTEYARHLVLSMTQYCVACHTRTSGGIEFSSRSGNEKIEALDAAERASYLISTRQFDLALAELQKQLSNQKLPEENIRDWERSTRMALSLSIRVKNDLSATQALLTQLDANPRLPEYLKAQVSVWKKSIQDWDPKSLPKTEKALNAEAKKLIASAKKTQEYGMDPSAQVYLLRASALLHEQLRLFPRGKLTGPALHDLGLAYETLESVGIFELKDYYYLLCMKESPHSAIAQSCYRQYERGVYDGYTGSGGTHVPEELQARLKELKTLSTPTQKSGAKKPL